MSTIERRGVLLTLALAIAATAATPAVAAGPAAQAHHSPTSP